MKLIVVSLILISNVSLMSQGNTDMDYINLNQIKIQKNTDLFEIRNIANEQILILEGNQYNEEIDNFTEKK